MSDNVADRGIAVAKSATRDSRRSIAANILVAVAVVVTAVVAAVDAYLLIQLNFVTRMAMLVVLLAVGWIPVTLALIAIFLRPYWLTFVALGVVGAAVIATLIVVWVAPDATYPYPQISWPRRGSW